MEEFKDIKSIFLIDFIFDLLFTEKQIQNKEIKEILLNLFREKKQNLTKKNKDFKDEFIFEKKENLENLVAIVYASFLIHLHLCIIGPTGVGKTASTKFISEILQEENGNYKLFPFYRNTKPRDLYGTMNLKEGKIEEHKGPLTDSAENGYIFIADEMNLSSKSTMNSLIPVLYPLLDKNIFIPTLDKALNIKEKFFFIACQNDIDNLGRNIVPDNLQIKIKNIIYPNIIDDEIINICKEKRNKEFKNKNGFTEENAVNLGKFMIKYNEIASKYHLQKWSFRDTDKIMKRIFEHMNDRNFKNFEHFHFIYFYLFSSIPKNELERVYTFENNSEKLSEILHLNFTKIFNINDNNSKELFDSYYSKPIGDIENLLNKKGKLSIKFLKLKEKMKEEEFNSILSNFYDDFFKLNLISQNEPIILTGPSSYKTKLAEFFIESKMPKLEKQYNIIF